MNKNEFQKGLKNLQSISLDEERKGKLFGALLRYAKNHPAKVEAPLTFFQKFKKLSIVRLFVK